MRQLTAVQQATTGTIPHVKPLAHTRITGSPAGSRRAGGPQWSISRHTHYNSYGKLGTKASGMSCRTPRSAAASLFEWALALEQDRERGRRSRSARGARPPCTSMCAAIFCCPFSRGALIPLLRSPSSASDGPSGEAAGMEANKRRLTLDLASTLQRWLKVWRSRASACSGAVKPPSTGRPTKGEADTRFSAAQCAIANTRWERLQDDMLSVPG